MELQTIAAIAVAILFVAGIIGSVVPWMPGPFLVLAGAVLWAIVTNFATLGAGRLAILTALAVASVVLNFVAGAVGARRYGSSRWGVMGAVLGAIVGLFFGPVGLLAGPVVGAVVAELAHGQTLEGGIRSGLGALIGFLAGIVADLIIAITMIGLFLWWVRA